MPAPIIAPAVLNIPIAPLKQFYAPMILLHLSLAMRVVGDLLGLFDLRRWGGMLNAVALLMFVMCMVYAARQARRSAQFSAQRFTAKGA